MNWNNLKKCLEEYSMYLLLAARNNMPTYYKLKDNIKFVMNVNGNFYEIIFNAPAYWKYANDGRRPDKKPPDPSWKRPPIDAIAKWISRRNITPHALKNGKTPKPEQLPYIIAAAIKRDGFRGLHFLEKSIDEQKAYWDEKISEAISNDIIAELDAFFNNPIFSIK